MRIGIVGFANVGKSTLFNLLLKSQRSATANFPFTTVEPFTGILKISDSRLENIGKTTNIERLTPATIELTDIAGLVPGAHQGLGLGNQFLAKIREVDGIIVALRAFSDENVVSVTASTGANDKAQLKNPDEEWELLKTELALADIKVLEGIIEKLTPKARTGEAAAKKEIARLEPLMKYLTDGKSDHKEVAELAINTSAPDMLMSKPRAMVMNTGDSDEERAKGNDLKELFVKKHPDSSKQVFALPIKILNEALVDLGDASMLSAYGIGESTLEDFIAGLRDAFSLITFYTCHGGKEVRAYRCIKGATAVSAAGKVHSDMEKGFINAEVTAYDDLAREGKVAFSHPKMASKDYMVQDGDILAIHFKN
ncbi:DUF933 domain-containing protein [Elusimicrobiota bacterium]